MGLMSSMVSAVEQRRSDWAARGIDCTIVVPDPDDPQGLAPVRIDAESVHAVAQILLWEGGDLHLIAGDAVTGEVLRDERREVTSMIGIEDALMTVEAHLSGGSE